MNDDPTLLASAYLDGDVTADERARAERDPDVVAEVERLRAVRALLGDLEAPAISLREAHLAAALDAWERLPEAERTGARRDQTPAGIDAAAVAGAASVTAPTPINARRRPTSTRWLTGAAAALVLVLAGGVALQLTGNDAGGDDADSAEESVALDAEAGSEERSGDDLGADELAPAATSADDAVNQLDTEVDGAAPPPEDGGLPQLSNTTDLADFAGVAVGAPVAREAAPDATSATEELSDAVTALTDAEPRCLGVDVVIGPAVYIDTAVVVGIDQSRDLALAYRPADCTEVARVRLP
jgi:hypothetical protein